MIQRIWNCRPLYILLLVAGLLLAQSCSTTKKCGCGADLNRVNLPRRYR
ncbi:MAG: hypothetical protein JST06_09510 [Bacteroidetes bacterium]|nr:hypothetical protein [Bacteroidota bacterium]MBS1628572.1 hypothetical protein [Bacteroidota bacterium]